MPVGAKRLLPQIGNAIFCRGQLGAYAKIALNGSFNALKKCLSRGGNAIFVEDQNTLNHCRE